MTKKDRLLELAWAAIAQIVIAIGQIGALKLIAVHTNPTTYGTYALGIAVSGTATLFIFGPICQLVMRYCKALATAAEQDVFAYILVRSYLLGVSALAILLLLGLPVSLMLGQWELFTILAYGCLIGCASGSSLLFVAAANAYGEHKIIAVLTLLDQCARILFLYAVITVFENPEGGLILASSCAATSLLLLVLCLFRHRTWQVFLIAASPLSDSSAAQKMLASRYVGYLLPFLGFAGFGAMGNFADRYILQVNCGTECVGVYAAAYSIAIGGVVLISNALTQVLIPMMFAQQRSQGTRLEFEREQERQLRVACLILCAVVLAGAILGFLFGERIMSVFASDKFLISARYLWILIIAIGVFHVGQLFMVKGLADERSHSYLAPKAIHAGLVVGLGTALASIGGVEGLIGAVLVSSFVYTGAVVSMHFRRRS